MKKVLSFEGRVLIEGSATGEALVSKRAFTFAHGVEPSTGVVTDIRSDLRGKVVKGKVLYFPFGKGSTTGAAWFLETVRRGNGPAAVLTQASEPIVVTGAVLADLIYGIRIPVMAEFSPDLESSVRSGDLVTVETKKREVRMAKGE
jgi:phosphomecalonate degydratase small subunit